MTLRTKILIWINRLISNLYKKQRKQFKLSPLENNLVNELENLINLGHKQIEKYAKVPHTKDAKKDLHRATLLQNVGIAHHLTIGIVAVAKKGSPEVGIILLRTLLEVSINVIYFSADKSGKRARSFYLSAEKKRRGVIISWLKFIDKYPEYEKKLKSKKELENFLKQLNSDIASIEKSFGKLHFPNLRARAEKTDKLKKKPDNEFMYITVYKHFCDFAHMSATGLHILLEKSEDAVTFLVQPHNKGLEMLLFSACGLYIGFLEAFNEQYSLPSNKKLKKSAQRIQDLSGGKIKLI